MDDVVEKAADDPRGKSVSERLPDDFRITIATSAQSTAIELAGVLRTEDEIDALITALLVFRAWITPAETDPPAALQQKDQ